jgi:hypothetical protein
MTKQSGSNRFPLVAGFIVVLVLVLATMLVIGSGIL